ncbi:lysophospholipase [Clostridium sp. YIM B02505]|uniref:Lysophospholipase n=1 Tax=Clostridium yunnanense TaxID=2800325 RepID=A0ABS1EUE4_9CLOT|nr:alpha/beta fold hydrolase [Clostridium yunnanense]MBK1813006.1 lysophospholipase [Clostridium yunnanense]
MNKDTEKSFFIDTKDEKKIFVRCWDDVSTPKGIVQIFHGMAEHSARYAAFARYLNSKNFIVYANDYRGHGRTDINNLGYIGRDGFNKIVEDEHMLTNIIKEKHVNIPVFIFAHSFGSFIGQEYIIKHGNEISGIMLSGSALRKGLAVHGGIVLSFIEKSLFGDLKKSSLLDFLSFYNYNKKIKKSKSKFDWLTKDSIEIQKYEIDPLCGNIATSGFYYYFLKGLTKLYDTNRLELIPKQLPVFIISGEDDPVGNYGVWVKNLYTIYKDVNLNNVNIKLYTGNRHELINELNSNVVFNDIVYWLNHILLD